MQDYFRRDVRFQDGLVASSSFASSSIVTSVDTISALPAVPAYVTVTVVLPVPHAVKQLLTNLITLIPGENVLSFIVDFVPELPEEALFMMPNINTLRLSNVVISEGFLQPNPNGPRANTKLLPSLQLLHLKDITVNDNDWSHLTTYLVHQTSNDQTISLEVTGTFPPMYRWVADEIRGLVEELTVTIPGVSNE